MTSRNEVLTPAPIAWEELARWLATWAPTEPEELAKALLRRYRVEHRP